MADVELVPKKDSVSSAAVVRLCILYKAKLSIKFGFKGFKVCFGHSRHFRR